MNLARQRLALGPGQVKVVDGQHGRGDPPLAAGLDRALRQGGLAAALRSAHADYQRMPGLAGAGLVDGREQRRQHSGVRGAHGVNVAAWPWRTPALSTRFQTIARSMAKRRPLDAIRTPA